MLVITCLTLNIYSTTFSGEDKNNTRYSSGWYNGLFATRSGNFTRKHIYGGKFSTDIPVLFDTLPVDITREDKYNWNMSSDFERNHGAFAPALNATDYRMYIDLIVLFKRICEEYNITYWLEGGSLFGVYKYHGFVPWDDDFDVKVNNLQKTTLNHALDSVEGHARDKRKFYGLNSYKRKSEANWPFIDIFFYRENATHILDAGNYRSKQAFAKSDIFPLEFEVFENDIFPVPRNSEAYLKKRYGMTLPCRSNSMNHRTDDREKNIFSIECDRLSKTYASVHRFKTENITYKQLRLGNKTLYTLRYPILKAHFESTQVPTVVLT